VIKLSNRNSLEALYYVWDTKPIDHLFTGEVEQFHEDLSQANVTKTEYLEYARNKQKEELQNAKIQIVS